MKISTLLTSMALAAFVVTGASAAGTTATSSTSTMMKSAKKPAAAMSTGKTAISKKCSSEADAKGLHGKAREKFRSACKKHGGNAS